MAENYKPKKIQAGKAQLRSVACPNCHQNMRGYVSHAEPVWCCDRAGCRLQGVAYKAVKVLVTLERD